MIGQIARANVNGVACRPIIALGKLACSSNRARLDLRMNETKAELRMAALARRALVTPETRQKMAEVLALKGVEIARRAMVRSVAAYWPIRDEADTTWLLDALAYHEFIAALPVVEARGRPLLFRKWTSRDPLIQGPHGVMEPSTRLPEVRPDIVFAPLAAFDRRGHRVGYGGGYYDITLRHLRQIKRVLAIGVAFATQEVASVPAETHDERLDFVITETEFIECHPD
jgi:5-formyltetrahydrofolate cyclo-ligase